MRRPRRFHQLLLVSAMLSSAGPSAGSRRSRFSPGSRGAQQAPQGAFASVRMLPFESETVHVPLTPSPAPSSSSPPPPVTGALTPAIAHDVVHAHLGELIACAAAGAVNGRVHGSITLRIVVDPHGGIRDVAVPQSTMIWSVPRCVTEAARRWRFPPPPTGLTIVIVAPFAFTSV